MSARRVLLTGRHALPAPSGVAQAIARRRLRTRIENTVSRLIDALDALDPDPEAEPWLGAPELPATCCSLVYLPGVGWQQTLPLKWARGANGDREDQDEHGGDVQDEAHDAEPDEDDGTAEPDGCELPKSQVEAERRFPT